MTTKFKMPQLGETVVEGTITRWLKREGESVAADESLLEVSTDKVDSEIPSPVAGVVSKVYFQEGDTVQVGQVICEIGDTSEGAGTQAAPEPTEVQPSAPALEAVKDESEVEVEVASGATPSTAESQESDSARRGILSPLVRKLAAENDLDLRTIKGTGSGGRITKEDVIAAAGSGPASPTAGTKKEPIRTPESTFAGAEETVPVSVMRRSIADHMVASLHETARAWNTIEVDMTAILRLREKAGDAFKEREGFSLTWMPFLCKAVVTALQKFAQVNSTWNGDGTITRRHYVNLGIAVALENGLIVPVVKGADGMNIPGLARGVRDVAHRARNKKLSPDEVHGGTFTITNPGPFGSILSVPIMNKGQAAILAFDAVVKRPVVITDEMGNDSIAIRHMVFISMSWDHRIIDGAEAAQFLAHLKVLLEEADFATDLSGYLTEA